MQGYLALQDGDMQTENIAPTIHSISEALRLLKINTNNGTMEKILSELKAMRLPAWPKRGNI
jgi:hypothetical protein